MTSLPASVLIVDDTVENLRLLAGLLTEHGFEPRPVTSGALALQAAERSPPDLILLDVTMPGMDGYQVCARLKAHAQLRHIPVIFLTALTDTQDKLQAFGAGAADYITKPFQFDEVLARVRVHLALRAAQLEIRSQYDKLQALERLRDDLVHMVVHDMRSPLMILMMQLDLLQDGVATLGEEATEDLRIASQSAASINRMANELLDVSRLEEGKLPLALAEADPSTLARAVSERLAGLDRSRTIDAVAAPGLRVRCDHGLITRVLENLVSNAIKYTPRGGAICIRCEPRPAGVRIAVQDEGPGVPPEARSRIFEKFQTGTAHQEAGFHSAGLGLAFCKLVVEAHGGRIGIEDAQPRGSIFWFELPA